MRIVIQQDSGTQWVIVSSSKSQADSILKGMVMISKYWYVVICLCLGFFVTLVRASSDLTVLHANHDDDRIKVYVDGFNDKEDGNELNQILIGKKACRHLETYNLGDDVQPVRTQILIANAETISESDREKTSQVIRSLIYGCNDGEQFSIATCGQHVTYISDFSDDYSVLKRLLDTLEYDAVDVQLARMLSQVIDDINVKCFTGLTRIVVFAPGMKDGSDSMSAKVLNERLEESLYPIYTIGYELDSNKNDLQDMYVLSDITHVDSFDITTMKDFSPILKKVPAFREIM